MFAIKELEELMVKHSAVIRVIPESVRGVFEKTHAEQHPNAEVKFLPEFQREMLVEYNRPEHAGEFMLEFVRHTGMSVRFAGRRYFKTLEEVAAYLQECSVFD